MKRLYLVLVAAALAAQAACKTEPVIGPAAMQLLNGNWSQWEYDSEGTCAEGYLRILVEADGKTLVRYWFDRASETWRDVPPMGVLGVETTGQGERKVQLFLPQSDGRAEAGYRSSRVTVTLVSKDELRFSFWSTLPPPTVRTPYGEMEISAHGYGTTYRRCPRDNQ